MTETNALAAGTPAHECVFPTQPPKGSFLSPGACETCGKTADRGQAERMLAEALAAMAATQPGPEGTLTPGRAIWDSLIETAVADFGRPADDFESWDAAPPGKRRRMEAAGLKAVAAYIDANGRDPLDAETTLLEAIGRPGYWQSSTALATATHALVMIAAGDNPELAGTARETLGKIDAIMGRDDRPADVSALRGHSPGCGCRDCCEDACEEQDAGGPVYEERSTTAPAPARDHQAEAGHAVVLADDEVVATRGYAGGVIVIAFAPNAPVERAPELRETMAAQCDVPVFAVADVAAIRAFEPHEVPLAAELDRERTMRLHLAGGQGEARSDFSRLRAVLLDESLSDPVARRRCLAILATAGTPPVDVPLEIQRTHRPGGCQCTPCKIAAAEAGVG